MKLLAGYFLLFLPAISAVPKFEDWHCGHTEDILLMTYNMTIFNCIDVAYDWNHCCVLHDECYTHQRGQSVCDTLFCECTKRALNKPGRNVDQECKDYNRIACLAMPFVGTDAYEKSINYTEPEDFKKYLPKDKELAAIFGLLYRECPHNNASISSCALMFNDCFNTTEVCKMDLYNCIHDIYNIYQETSCGHQTRQIREILQPSWLRVNWIWIATFFLIVFIATVKFFWCRNIRNRKNPIYFQINP